MSYRNLRQAIQLSYQHRYDDFIFALFTCIACNRGRIWTRVSDWHLPFSVSLGKRQAGTRCSSCGCRARSSCGKQPGSSWHRCSRHRPAKHESRLSGPNPKLVDNMITKPMCICFLSKSHQWFHMSSQFFSIPYTGVPIFFILLKFMNKSFPALGI